MENETIKNKLQIIPEYQPVDRLYLSFAHDFFNTRFGYGEVIAQMTTAARTENVEVEIFCLKGDEHHLLSELAGYGLTIDDIILNQNYSGTAITTTGFPIIGRDQQNRLCGLTYQTYSPEIDPFGNYICNKEKLCQTELGFKFNSASIVVNDRLALVCSDALNEAGRDGMSTEQKKEILANSISQKLYFVPQLEGDYTKDLDTYLWPIKDGVWISAKYLPDSPQAESIKPTLELLQNLGETVHQVPGLEKIICGDIDTLPNYQNGVLINKLALVLAYQRKEDEAICNILADYGFTVKQIDCRRLVESNAVLHCISRTRPGN